MYVNRDFFETLGKVPTLEAVILWGPRQIGKTTLLSQLDLKSKLFFDDLNLRSRAQTDPRLVLDNAELPVLLDEVQYVPNIFPELKFRIDQDRLKKRETSNETKTSYFLTGSNRSLLDHEVKESLAGRANLFELHGLSVKEVRAAFPEIDLKRILLLGGFPQLYLRSAESPVSFLNDYILSFVEKDIAQSSGVTKLREFETLLRLLAARTGQFLNLNQISRDSGVDHKTIQSWIYLLERNHIIRLVSIFATNLSKRLLKMSKLYFFDTALSARLQSHQAADQMWASAQVGQLFETLVFSEIVKTKANFLKDWQLFTWRTKEHSEIDFVLQLGDRFILIEAKLAIHGAKAFSLDNEAKKVFKSNFEKLVVTAGGDQTHLDRDTIAVPIFELGSYLLSRDLSWQSKH